MGRRSSWFSAVKKALSCGSKEKKEKKSRKGKWFRKQRSIDLDSLNTENATVVAVGNEEVKLIEAENEQNRQAYSVALVTAMAAEAAVAAANAAAEIVRLRAAAASSYNSSCKTKEVIAAIKIQAAFRGYLARRSLRALRGLMRLKSVIEGKSVKRQAVGTLKCMQTMARVQSEIRSRRIKMSDESSAIQRQIQQKHDMELEKSRESIGENWDASTLSKEKIEANTHNRQEAAMRRERALAYAYSHQQTCRSSSNSVNQTFMDPNNPRWGWSWLERWMAARPWETGNTVGKEPIDDIVSAKLSTSSYSISVHGDFKIQFPTAQKRSQHHSRHSPSTPKSKAAGKIRPPSPRGTIGTDDESKSINSTQSEQCRRHSIAGSSVRDDESFASSSAVPSYMASTESARAKSRLPSPQGSEKHGSGSKKRLSFSGSPARTKRHPIKSDSTPVNGITTNS